jgi:two-component system chemotaxis sensor kinase CheA
MDMIHSILIVEDDTATCALYERVLGGTYRVIVRSNSAQALKVLRSQPISVIVLEPSVAYGQGWALIADVRAAPAISRVPIVVCSSVDARLRGLALGGTAYLLKPIQPNALLATLRQLV